MSRCYCRVVLSILVIVFAWLSVSWANIALTVLGLSNELFRQECLTRRMHNLHHNSSKAQKYEIFSRQPGNKVR